MTTLAVADIGYNAVKAMSTNGRKAHFPSVLGTEKHLTYSMGQARAHSMSLTMAGGQVWSVGHTALKQSEYATGRRDPEWVLGESWHVLLCAAFSELFKKSVTTKVVSGLPIEHYGAYADQVRDVLIGEHRFKRNGGNWQTVTVGDAMVITQPYGSLLDQAMSDTGRILANAFSEGVVGVADLGGATMNLLVTDALEEIGQWTQGDGLGLLKALDQIARSIHRSCPGITPKAREVSVWLAKGTFPYKGQEHDITPYAEPFLDPLVDMVLNRFSEVWREPGRFSAVLLTGGGSMALGPALKSRMNGVYPDVTIAKGADFGNVRGYLKLARDVWG
jgi:hypothetical protein